MTDASNVPPPASEGRRANWLLKGMLGAFSIPGLILVSSFVGFAALAKDAGVTAAQAVFMTGVVWALPSKVVLIGAAAAGVALPAVALAVSLSAIRLMPMTMALTPELRTEKTPRWVLYALSHCVAVTSWVLALEHLKDVPRPMRTTYYAGLGTTLILGNMGVVALVYALADALPSTASAALLMLTPMYFLTSLWGSARERAGHVAMILGIVLGPVFHMLVPEGDLLIAGFAGGLLAYTWHKVRRNKTA
jgi:predicted branched-subunit amino acid permease